MIKKINAIKNVNAGKIMQTGDANSEQKYSEIEHLSTNE